MQKRFFGGLYMLVFLFLFSVDVQAKDVSVQLDVEGLPEAPRAQDDFYLHVNYDWLKNTPIPEDAGRVDGFSGLDQQVRMRLRAITTNAQQKL